MTRDEIEQERKRAESLVNDPVWGGAARVILSLIAELDKRPKVGGRHKQYPSRGKGMKTITEEATAAIAAARAGAEAAQANAAAALEAVRDTAAAERGRAERHGASRYRRSVLHYLASVGNVPADIYSDVAALPLSGKRITYVEFRMGAIGEAITDE